jgi:anti-sigma-K factor RskA
MNRLPPEILDALAAEYVLGTLTGRVRARLSRMMQQDARLAARVAWWDDKLAPLGDAVPAVPAPLRVWRRLEEAIGPDSAGSAARRTPRAGWWNSLPVWRWSTAMASVLAIALVFAPVPQPPPVTLTPEGGLVLVLTDDESRTAWLVSRRTAADPLRAQPLALPVLTLEQAYELWLLPPDAAPLSLGLLDDTESTVLQVPDDLSTRLQPGFGMAVSIEPPGGSPTGAPTGPVVFTGSIREL